MSSTWGRPPASTAAMWSPRARPPTSWPSPGASPANTSPARARSPVPEDRRPVGRAIWLKVIGARGNNLKSVTGEIPVGVFTCVTGVSGGGKSTFTIETLYKAAARRLNNASDAPAPHERIEGLEFFDKVIDIDQSPIGRTPRSNPATYTGAFQPIRDWFSQLPESKARGYGPGRFSFNVKGGRCEACQGDGLIKIEMHFLPDVYVTLRRLQGQAALQPRDPGDIVQGRRSVSDILDMTVEEAADFFKAVPSVRDKMETLKRVGLGYVHVGQPATTLSGGEAQRVKLSKEACRAGRPGAPLYILDEPTATWPALRRYPQAVGSAARTGRQRQHHGGDRAQPGCDQDRRLAAGLRSRGRRSRRRDRRLRHAGGRRRQPGQLDGPLSRRRCCSATRNAAASERGRRAEGQARTRPKPRAQRVLGSAGRVRPW